MNKLEEIYLFNKTLLGKLNVEYQEWHHEPILDFTTDERVAKELGWTGTHTKSLFLQLKGAGFALFLTDKDSRLDSKGIKALLGKRPSIVSNEAMSEVTGCVAGAVCPFGLPVEIPIVVDRRLYGLEQLLYTPGHPECTFGIAASDLHIVLSALNNPIFEL
ncbi:YbaK/EbsC family protein [Vibrio sp. NH-7]